MLPLESDSINICKELGLEYVTMLKMALAQMPGNRVDEETVNHEQRIFVK